jgi:hypothetical protein
MLKLANTSLDEGLKPAGSVAVIGSTAPIATSGAGVAIAAAAVGAPVGAATVGCDTAVDGDTAVGMLVDAGGGVFVDAAGPWRSQALSSNNSDATAIIRILVRIM